MIIPVTSDTNMQHRLVFGSTGEPLEAAWAQRLSHDHLTICSIPVKHLSLSVHDSPEGCRLYVRRAPWSSFAHLILDEVGALELRTELFPNSCLEMCGKMYKNVSTACMLLSTTRYL